MEEKKEMICPFCGGRLTNDGMEAAEQVKWNYDRNDNALMHYMCCTKCGRDFEVIDPKKEAKDTSYKEYWDKQDSRAVTVPSADIPKYNDGLLYFYVGFGRVALPIPEEGKKWAMVDGQLALVDA